MGGSCNSISLHLDVFGVSVITMLVELCLQALKNNSTMLFGHVAQDLACEVEILHLLDDLLIQCGDLADRREALSDCLDKFIHGLSKDLNRTCRERGEQPSLSTEVSWSHRILILAPAPLGSAMSWAAVLGSRHESQGACPLGAVGRLSLNGYGAVIVVVV